MRPGQQNKRSRGRGNNNNNNNNNFNRKGANPLTRTYDSSGPDVKIRGTAQHIAEKYLALARDAQSSGDRVIAENYLQHAEHYNRIIASAQAQMQERFQRDERNDVDDNDGDDEMVVAVSQPQQQNRQPERQEQRPTRPVETRTVDADGPQPVIEGIPAEVMAEEAEGQPASGNRSGPRRRTANGARPRRAKREENAADPAEALAAGEAPAAAEAAVAQAEAQPEAEKKPPRRKRAPRAEATDAKDGAEQPKMAAAETE